MCGIAGRVNLTAPIDRAELFEMTERLAHRGPDDQGYHLRPRVGLGHRRLSIVDRSGGRQPLGNEDETVWIVFNGEIYNHADLRSELRALGHRFKTKSDTEAIVHAYEEWGAVGCARRLRGMFAFAVWDEHTQTLTLVRDRLGIKPLYWAPLGGDLAFASEVKALLAISALDSRVDDDALGAYLALRYVPGPKTLFRGVQKLPPGTMLTWRRGHLQEERWWDLGDRAPMEVPPTEAEAALELRERIDESTRLRLMSEVPLGAFLSGGLDSTMIAASMIRAMDGAPLKTFSVGYREEATRADSELSWARRAAQALGTEHREVLVDVADALEALPRIVWHLDEPVADPSCVPLYFLARRAKEEVTVVLSGEGADEILGGYHVYQRLTAIERWRSQLGPALPASARLAGLFPSERLRRVARFIEGPLAASYHGVSRAFDDAGRARLLPHAPPIPLTLMLAPFWDRSRGWSPLRRMLYFDTRVWLPDDLLIKADKMTMAHAVELRVPFLDHQLVEHAWALPDRLKVHRSVGKLLLRRAARGRIPRFVIERKKEGFSTPTAAWLRRGLDGLLGDALFGSRSFTRDRFDLAHVRSLVERHRAGENLSAELWPLLILELWYAQLSHTARAPSRTPSISNREPFHAAS